MVRWVTRMSRVTRRTGVTRMAGVTRITRMTGMTVVTRLSYPFLSYGMKNTTPWLSNIG